MSAILNERALARTHGHRDYRDLWELVIDWRRYQHYRHRNPDAGFSELRTHFDALPKSRLGSWFHEENEPVVISFLDRLREQGILDTRPGQPVFEALNTLVAWVHTQGNINQKYTPVFNYASDGERKAITDALDTVGFGWRDGHEAPDQATRPIRITDHAADLGRTLAVLDAPAGPHAASDARVPAYLRGAPATARRRFVEVVARTRASEVGDQLAVHLGGTRTATYRDELVALFEAVCEGVEREEQYVLFERPHWNSWEPEPTPAN